MRSIQLKLLVRFILATAVALIISALIASFFMARHIRSATVDQLEDSAGGVAIEIESLRNDLASLAHEAEKKSLIDALRSRDRARVLGLLSDVRRGLNLDMAALADAEGVVMARAESPAKYGDGIAHRPEVRKALAGATVSSLSVEASGLGVTAFVPLNAKGKTLGVLKLGRILDHRFVTDIQRRYGTEVIVMTSVGVQATSIDDPKVLLSPKLVAISQSVRDGIRGGVTETIRIEGESFYIKVNPLLSESKQALGALLVIVPATESALAISEIFRVLFVVSLLLFVGVAFYGVAMSRNLIRPIRRLTDDAGLLGRDLSVRTDATSNDEIGTLAKAFNSMADTIQDREGRLKDAQAKLFAQERLATLGRLAATVSHELRNPLGTIGTALYSIRGRLGDTSPKVSEALDRAERNVERCDRIIEELLDFTRSDLLRLEQATLDEWLQELLNQQAIPDEIDLDVHLESKVDLELDWEKIRRCVINVTANACQAMQGNETFQKKMRLSVSSWVRESRVEVEFADTGPGISEDDMEHIFEPLFSTKSFGVGLGLPVVKEIMEAHGGGIEVESQRGVGAKIILWFPLSGGEGL